jgi:Flp pilus assembly protein TadB
MGEKELMERMAREKAEKRAMQEAMGNNIVIWFPLFLIGFMMLVAGAPVELSGVFIVLALIAGTISAMITWDSAYKKHYEKCLAELKIIKTSHS